MHARRGGGSSTSLKNAQSQTQFEHDVKHTHQSQTQFEQFCRSVAVEGLSVPGKVEVSWAAAPGTLAPGKMGTVVVALRAVCVGVSGSRMRL